MFMSIPQRQSDSLLILLQEAEVQTDEGQKSLLILDVQFGNYGIWILLSAQHYMTWGKCSAPFLLPSAASTSA